ncbi:UPF0481 protein At3g47200-like isoform X2 [Phoenix dactylifera]|nr:UPF0481 protein At3g47200-like isoform X2 [Phoenix dactylifera]XP_026660222.2 UPF0481 protein At3g47200-like isoform X2 [Phoenix dactylifera]
MDSSEKTKGKEKVETMEVSKTISSVGGERNPSAAGGLSPGDILATDVWAEKMLDKIKVVLQKPPSYTASKSISTAPASTEDRDKKLYEPRAVAIGPYHRKAENNYFRITDEHKLWCVKEVIVLAKKKKEEVIVFHQKLKEEEEEVIGEFLRKFVGKMKEREEDAVKFYRKHYGTGYNFRMDSQSFLEMLMLDSCFILFALSLRYDIAKVIPILFGLGDITWAPRDIVEASELVKTDLLLLNNQIPFFILEDVFKMKNDIDPTKKMQNGGTEGNGSIRKVAFEFFSFLDLGGNSSQDTETTEVDHLLDLYHMYLKPPVHPGRSLLGDILPFIDPPRSLPSATKLQQKSAVNFKVKKWKVCRKAYLT